MELWEKISATVTNTGREVASKAKELAEIAGLNARIATEEAAIEKCLKEVGRFLYEHRENPCDNGLEERFKLVDEHYAEIARLKKEIRILKGVKVCEDCGAEVKAGVPFCGMCGHAVPEDVPEEVVAEEVCDVTDSCCGEAECDCAEECTCEEKEFCTEEISAEACCCEEKAETEK